MRALYIQIHNNIGEGNNNKGVFLVTTIIAFIPIERILSMNTDSGISTVPRGSERSE